MDNILATIKKSIGVSQEDQSFDVDLIMFINTTLVILGQLGVDEAYQTPIVDDFTTWEDLIGERTDLEIIKTYMHYKTKMMFDPPTSTALIEAYKANIAELEWRIVNLDRNKGVTTVGK